MYHIFPIYVLDIGFTGWYSLVICDRWLEAIPYLMPCGDALLISIEQLQHWYLHMYWLCLQVDGSNSYLQIYIWHLGSDVWIWMGCQGFCMDVHGAFNLQQLVFG